MKKTRLKKFLSLILLLPAFLLAGCDGFVSTEGVTVPGAVSPDKSHTTSEYPFLGAYVVIDPGSDGEFDDGYSSKKNVKFTELLERQFDTISKDVAYRLSLVYGNSDTEISKEIQFGTTDHKVSIEKHNIIKEMNGITAVSLDANKVDTWAFLNDFVEGTVDSTDVNLNILKQAFKTKGAIEGGYNYDGIVEETDEGGNTIQKGQFSTTINPAFKWSVSSSELEVKIKQAIIKAVSGIVGSEEEQLKAINHLGFTASDKEKMLAAILNDVIGETAINNDKSNKESLQRILGKGGSDELTITAEFNKKVNDSADTLNIDEHEEWKKAHEYKAYELIVKQIIETAINAGNVTEDVDIYSTLPRAQVMYMDIYTLQGTSKEEVDKIQNATSEDENFDYTENEDYQYIEGEEIPPLEKYLPDMNLISIILLPNAVTSSPNKFENGKLVPDTSIKYDGFILGSIDFAMSGEAGYNSTLYADIEIKAKGKSITVDGEHNFSSNSVELYGDRIPENDDESNYNVYIDLLPEEYVKDGGNISKQDMLIGGYDGKSIEDPAYGFSYTNLKSENGGSYKLYKLKTGTDFMGYGDGGVSFESGNNYVKVNFIFTEIFNASDTNKQNNIVNTKVNTLINLLSFNPEAC